ncbi:MAG: energy-coupling factor transporter transmembrane component T family protein [Candidatus Limnocylindrus sp.]
MIADTRSVGRDARAAVVATIAFVTAVALLPPGSYLALILAWLLLAFAGALLGIGPGHLARRGLVALPFVVAAVPIVFLRSDELLWAGTIGPLSLQVSGAGLRIALTALMKAWISVQASVLLLALASPPSIVTALRRMRLPAVIATSAGLTIRYLEILRDEARRMLRARTARSASPVGDGRERIGGTISWRARTTGSLVGSLFLRAYSRAQRIEDAAASRGATGSLSIGTMPAADSRLTLKVFGVLLLVLIITLSGALLPRL